MHAPPHPRSPGVARRHHAQPHAAARSTGSELTVSELCAVMQLPQSTVSRHLKALGDGGWITLARRRHEPPLHDDARRPRRRPRGGCGCWCASRSARRRRPRAGSAAAPGARSAERRTTSQEFFSSSAGQWDRLRDELFGDRFHLAALAALADATWTVGDLGCGTGQVSAALAPFVARVIAVDASAAMLQAAQSAAAGVRQRRSPARRARGAADRRRAARRGDADAGAASRAGSGAGAGRSRRACSSRAGG